MAGNKVNTKTKGKEGKTQKSVTQSNDDCEDAIDFAVLRKPIPTSVTGFAQARKIFDLATEELKDLLSNECDLMYECKVCRNIFRSLANFISHKRVYCRDKFSSTVHSHFVNNTNENEMLKIKRTEETYQESLKVKTSIDSNDNEDSNERIPLTKDITAVYEKIIKARGMVSNENSQVVLKNIPNSNVAVFQHMETEDKSSDSMKAEVQELDQILSRKRAVLQNDGKFLIENDTKLDSENVIQISDDDENGDELKCKICDLQFSTQKTLKFHMKYKHLESRLVYPCPDCLEIFSTSWSVYRHLFKVHRKTAAQIRRLRESIQSKAFKMNNPPAFYEKRKNVKTAAPQQITEEERRDQENQAWMDNMEGDGEVPRCGGCGRTFERRAALAAHTHTCQPRSRALARPPRPDAKKIEIQIRKDYNKGPPGGASLLKPVDNDNKNVAEETESKPKPLHDDDKDETEESAMNVDEDDQKSNTSAESPEKNIEEKMEVDIKPVIRLPFALQAEKSNLAAFKQRITPEIDTTTLQCKKCGSKHTSAVELYEHVADHVKWMRYACKLCNFKHYSFEKLPEHVKVVHKLKGDSDFYHTTVKAIDGKEAMVISNCLADQAFADEATDPNESPESRRPSRCSSDSSRLSDDSSSSSTLKETVTRKRKMHQSKSSAKKKKDTNVDNGEDQEEAKEKALVNNYTPSPRAFEENSSDLEDIEEKITKRHHVEDNTPSVSSRRPVRKRTKVKNADFEYDLSNLLKMEAQGYRDSQSTTTTTKITPVAIIKAPQPKKKVQPETSSNNNYEALNQDCCGALMTLSKKAVDKAAAHMKTPSFPIFSKEQRPSVFVRPMIPRILARGDKSSPKKDVSEDLKENPNQNQICKIIETVSLKCTETMGNGNGNTVNPTKEKEVLDLGKPEDVTKVPENVKAATTKNDESESKEPKPIEQNGTELNTTEKVEKGNLSIPAVMPLKFRRQSLDIMSNHPIINKNITEFSKAGMKTKILVIKPIHRNKSGKHPANTPLKFQTIKLKDPSIGSSSEVKPSDQVMVVKVPKVPCTSVSNKATLTLIESAVAAKATKGYMPKKCEENEVTINVIEEKCEAKNETDNKQETVIGHENGEDKKCESNEPVITEMEPASDNLVVEPVADAENSKAIEVVPSTV